MTVRISRKKISVSALELIADFRASRQGGDPIDAALTKLAAGIERQAVLRLGSPEEISHELYIETKAAIALLSDLNSSAADFAAQINRQNLN